MSAEPEKIDKWTAEYDRGGIPSSVRTSPSNAVVAAFDELRRQKFPLHRAVDIGCGKGRNSLYLAQQGMNVTSLDFMPNAIEALQDNAEAQGLDNKIRAIVHDVTENWPVEPRSIDFAVDAFCFKHIAPNSLRLNYKKNLLNAMDARGHYLVSFASIGDGYYGRYIVRENDDKDEGMETIVDPSNGIASVLYSRKLVVKFFEPELELFAEMFDDKPSVMHGKEYKRETHALIFRFNPRWYEGN